MPNHSLQKTNIRHLLPETLWIEPEQFEQAKAIADRSGSEEQQWQSYINVLGQFAFQAWLEAQLPHHDLICEGGRASGACSLQVGDFKICLITAEQVLDEVINIPGRTIEQPNFAAHFYVVLEVLEEQEAAIIRGFLRYDELQKYTHSLPSAQPEAYLLPLAALDAEINHLLTYIQYLDPSPLALPVASPSPAAQQDDTAQRDLSHPRVRLSQWLQNVLDEGWQTLDQLINPEDNLAWATRHSIVGVRGGKLINLGMQLGKQTVVLLVTVTPDAEGKISINVQVLPHLGESVLPPQLKLTLLSSKNKILQEVESRVQDNYIQLKPFKGKTGTCFSIEVSLNTIGVREAFEL